MCRIVIGMVLTVIVVVPVSGRGQVNVLVGPGRRYVLIAVRRRRRRVGQRRDQLVQLAFQYTHSRSKVLVCLDIFIHIKSVMYSSVVYRYLREMN